MKIDKNETYQDGCLSVNRGEICCYPCLNYKFDTEYECLVHGKINSLISSRCDEYNPVIFDEEGNCTI